jgi:hypothetical protein
VVTYLHMQAFHVVPAIHAFFNAMMLCCTYCILAKYLLVSVWFSCSCMTTCGWYTHTGPQEHQPAGRELEPRAEGPLPGRDTRLIQGEIGHHVCAKRNDTFWDVSPPAAQCCSILQLPALCQEPYSRLLAF